MAQDSIKQIMALANELLKQADTGKEYTMGYVIKRLDAALDEYPHDPVLGSIAQVIHKQASKGKLTTSQKELYDLYNHFARYSANSMIKEALGDILYPVDNAPKTTTIDRADTFGRSDANDLDLTIANNELEGIFDKQRPVSKMTAASANQSVSIQDLAGLGTIPAVIKAFAGNNTEVTTGPVKVASSIVDPSFAFDENVQPIQMDRVQVPEALADLVAFEEAAVESTTQFTPELIRTAKALCSRELDNMGFRSQVKVTGGLGNCIVCSAELDSSIGKVEIQLPVEVVDSRPQIPELFYNENEKDRVYDFSKAELSRFLTAAKTDENRLLRYSNDFFHMTYAQLRDEILQGAANHDYTRAEQALNRISDKFGAQQHLSALSDYAKYLASTSVNADEAPAHKCRLLITKGSIEPRCGHYNVPISKVLTDEAGNCELMERKAKYENMNEDGGTLIRTNKITLT